VFSGLAIVFFLAVMTVLSWPFCMMEANARAWGRGDVVV